MRNPRDKKIDRVTKTARVVSLTFYPAITAPLGFIIILYLSGLRLPAAIGWAALAWAIVMLPMLIFVSYKLSKNQVSDVDVSVREQRYDVFMVGGVCMLICFVTLLVLDAPSLIIAMFIGGLATLAVYTLTTKYVSKLSIHTGTIAGFAVAAGFYSWAWAITLTAVTCLVAWSRLRLKQHTPAQVVSGSLVAAGIFYLVMLTQQ